MDNRYVATLSGKTVSDLGHALVRRSLDLESIRFVGLGSLRPSLVQDRLTEELQGMLRWMDSATICGPTLLPDGGREPDDFMAHTGRGTPSREKNNLDRTATNQSSDDSLAKGATVERTRHRLKRAFDHHLHRVVKGETSHVVVRVATPLSTGTYRYLDNGSDQGGAHYFRGLTPQTKADIISCASAAGLTVLIEGTGSVSVSFETKAVEDDIRFVEMVLVNVFDTTFAEIISIEEVIDSEKSREWLY